MKKKRKYLPLLLTAIFMAGCTEVTESEVLDGEVVVETSSQEEASETVTNTTSEETTNLAINETSAEANETKTETVTASIKDQFAGYKMIEVYGGDLSGHREANVVVNIGFGDRKYFSFTNEYGQLVRVIADELILQDDDNEPVNSSGRYYSDEAKVPGVESATLDEGHVIADSLGGVSNAYNITPQDSVLNRHGDQAYMERNIREAGGATNFEAIITYPNTTTQTPSHYKYTYTINGHTVVDEFANGNPDKTNKSLGLTESKSTSSTNADKSTASSGTEDISSIDTNGNGVVTIKEAKAAGYKMPITSDHWLYKFMIDNDGDGMVGE